MGAFTTFYNRLRCLDTLPWTGLYSLALRQAREQSARIDDVQEMAIDGPDANAPDAGAGHSAAGGRVDGFQHLESEAHPAGPGDRSRHPARFQLRAEDRGERKLGKGKRSGYSGAQGISRPRR